MGQNHAYTDQVCMSTSGLDNSVMLQHNKERITAENDEEDDA